MPLYSVLPCAPSGLFSPNPPNVFDRPGALRRPAVGSLRSPTLSVRGKSRSSMFAVEGPTSLVPGLATWLGGEDVTWLARWEMLLGWAPGQRACESQLRLG